MQIERRPTTFVVATLFAATLSGCYADHYDSWEGDCHGRRCDDDWSQPPDAGSSQRRDGGRDGRDDAGSSSGRDAGSSTPDASSTCERSDEAIELSNDPAVCATITFSCPATHVAYNDACGCGCEVIPPEPVCPEADDPTARYLSTDPAVCALVDIDCPDGTAVFNSPCGCGCLGDNGPDCPSEDDPDVTYVSKNQGTCSTINFTCTSSAVRFDSECGCGCVAP